jgi:thiol-disulfide isomerase/thioredoxin
MPSSEPAPVSDSRKTKRSEKLSQRREDRAKRKSQPVNKGAGRNVWIAAIGAAVIGVLAIGIFAISSGDDGSNTTASGGTASSSDGRFPIIPYQRPDKIGTEEIDFTELLGTGQPVVLNFWAGQCPPCRAEMPAFQNVHDTYGEDFLLVGVDVGPYIGLGSRDSALNLLSELGITYPAAGAQDARAVQDYNVLSMPTTIFYDGEGVEVARQVGLLQEDVLLARVQEIVGA